MYSNNQMLINLPHSFSIALRLPKFHLFLFILRDGLQRKPSREA
ncbi:hypothetical protein E2C01_041865 [Portunus trituberculatus]|uniref:Uncharacterized protein n=1 Tax=Portunus trituberculatus TaxID=210409 RepID=A0A5B7FKB9_PORTR|nr:hypothetical protein [Portunus trituberculatus]